MLCAVPGDPYDARFQEQLDEKSTSKAFRKKVNDDLLAQHFNNHKSGETVSAKGAYDAMTQLCSAIDLDFVNGGHPDLFINALGSNPEERTFELPEFKGAVFRYFGWDNPDATGSSAAGWGITDSLLQEAFTKHHTIVDATASSTNTPAGTISKDNIYFAMEHLLKQIGRDINTDCDFHTFFKALEATDTGRDDAYTFTEFKDGVNKYFQTE